MIVTPVIIKWSAPLRFTREAIDLNEQFGSGFRAGFTDGHKAAACGA